MRGKSAAANHEPQTEHNSSDKNLDLLVKDIKSKLEFAKSSKQPAAQDCIIRSVNPLLRQVNEAAYRPVFVIIGPLRSYDSLLERMELQKRIYLDSFLKRTGNGATVTEFCKLIKASAPKIHSCYEKTYYRRCDFQLHQIQQNIVPPSVGDDNLGLFIEMVLVDAAFIIELFLKVYYKEGRAISPSIAPGRYMLQYSFDRPSSSSNRESFFKRIKVCVGSIWSSLFPSCQKTEDNPELESGRVPSKYLYSATLLRAAGVKFRESSSRCLLDIKFNRNNGKLKIPPLKLDYSTEPFFRNVMGWEQSYYPEETHVCDYVFLMEYLIKSAEDVDLLARKRIIINQLGSHKAVVTLFNDLCKHIPQAENNCYSETFRNLNAYNAVRYHGWIAKLRLLYFSSLWTSVATVVAVLLILLTLPRTIRSIIAL
ncbi:hypothetical protein GQ457_01G007710 [Hibiscus cannabinus]